MIKYQLLKYKVLVIFLILLHNILTVNAQIKTAKIDPLKFKVVFFLAPDCPISQQYTRTINQFFEKYKNNCTIVVYMGEENNYKTKRTHRKFVRKYNFLPVINSDLHHQVAKQLGATITPEVFIVDHNNLIYYHGAIDNWFFALGKARPQITQHYLEDAMENILQHIPVKIAETKAIGCYIEYN